MPVVPEVMNNRSSQFIWPRSGFPWFINLQEFFFPHRFSSEDTWQTFNVCVKSLAQLVGLRNEDTNKKTKMFLFFSPSCSTDFVNGPRLVIAACDHLYRLRVKAANGLWTVKERERAFLALQMWQLWTLHFRNEFLYNYMYAHTQVEWLVLLDSILKSIFRHHIQLV